MSGDLDPGPENDEPEGYIVGLDDSGTTHYLSQYDKVSNVAWWAPGRYYAASKLVAGQLYDVCGANMSHVVHSFKRLRRGEATPTTPAITICDMWFEPKVEYRVHSLALYLIDRVFGGPEEGGWWYDVGTPVSLEEAEAIIPHGWQPYYCVQDADGDLPDEVFSFRDQRNAFLDRTINVGRPSINSVISEGVYQFCIVEGPPHQWPKVTPHYE